MNNDVIIEELTDVIYKVIDMGLAEDKEEEIVSSIHNILLKLV